MGCLQFSQISLCVVCDDDKGEEYDHRRRERRKQAVRLLDDEAKLSEEPVLEILSPTFTQEDVNDWAAISLLSGHEPLRQGLEMLVEITDLKYYEDGDESSWKKQIKLLYQWFNDIFYFYVHHSQKSEMETYFPWLETRAEKVPAKLYESHEQLATMLEAMKQKRADFFDSKGNLNKIEFPDHLRDLHRKAIAFKTEMGRYLNEKEEVVPKLLRKHGVTQEEEGEIIQQIMISLKLGNKIFLPWIIDSMRRWAGQQFVDEFMQQIPGPIKFTYETFWLGHFLKYNKGIIKRIASV